MSFKYSCIGDNSPENREHLEKIGYVRGFFNIPNRCYIKTINPGTYNMTNIIQPLTEYINCIGNSALFQAVTAMREGSDKWQFFVHEDGSFVFCDQGELKYVIDNEYMYQKYAVSEFHKASLSELQEHFK